MMVQLIRAKFAGAQPERVLMDGRTTIEVARVADHRGGAACAGGSPQVVMLGSAADKCPLWGQPGPHLLEVRISQFDTTANIGGCSAVPSVPPLL
jgi:hypothetical protein